MEQANTAKLEKHPLWAEVNALAELAYQKAGELPDEEKWALAAKMRNASQDLVLWAAMAIGNPSPFAAEFEWASAHKYASGLKALYRLGGRQKYYNLEPEVMVRFDKMLDQMEEYRVKARKTAQEFNDSERAKDLKPWLEKHKIWQQINGH